MHKKGKNILKHMYSKSNSTKGDSADIEVLQTYFLFSYWILCNAEKQQRGYLWKLIGLVFWEDAHQKIFHSVIYRKLNGLLRDCLEDCQGVASPKSCQSVIKSEGCLSLYRTSADTICSFFTVTSKSSQASTLLKKEWRTLSLRFMEAYED